MAMHPRMVKLHQRLSREADPVFDDFYWRNPDMGPDTKWTDEQHARFDAELRPLLDRQDAEIVALAEQLKRGRPGDE